VLRLGSRRRPTTGHMGVSMRECFAFCLSVFIALSMPASAGPLRIAQANPVQQPTGLTIQRAGQPSRLLSPDRLAALPQVTERVGFTTGRGEQQNEWTGPLLWDVLGASGVIADASPREQAHLAVRITGADGYAAVVSVGEISPQFADRKVLVADQLNGAPLPNHALRLIVPGDLLGGRSVRDVVRIEVE
jgi:DMSO/TMAO reductase YedYZ molybdopterin-dependent catalytic subunit